MKKTGIAVCLLVAALASCSVLDRLFSTPSPSPSPSPSPTSSPAGIVRTITGTVHVSVTDVKIGAFSDAYWFLNDFSGTLPSDVVDHEYTAMYSGSFPPLTIVVPDSSGAYSFDLPEDPTTMENLIAWVDSNHDGIFDLGAEAGYFPVKVIDSNLETITGFGSYSYGSLVGYLVSYGGMYNSDFATVGTSGFDFNID